MDSWKVSDPLTDVSLVEYRRSGKGGGTVNRDKEKGGRRSPPPT